MGKGLEELLLKEEQMRKNVEKMITALEKFSIADTEYRRRVAALAEKENAAASQKKKQKAAENVAPEQGKTMNELLEDIEPDELRRENSTEASDIIDQGKSLLKMIDTWKQGGYSEKDKAKLDNAYGKLRRTIQDVFSVYDIMNEGYLASSEKLKKYRAGQFTQYDLADKSSAVLLHAAEIQVEAARMDVFGNVLLVGDFLSKWKENQKIAEAKDKEEIEALEEKKKLEDNERKAKKESEEKIAGLERQIKAKLVKWTKAEEKQIGIEPEEIKELLRREEVRKEEPKKEEPKAEIKKEEPVKEVKIEEAIKPEEVQEESIPEPEDIEELKFDEDKKPDADKEARSIYAQDVEKAQDEYDQGMVQVQADYDRGLKQAQTDYELANSKAQIDYEGGLNQAQKEQDTLVQSAQEKHDTAAKEAQKQYDIALEELRKKYNQDLNIQKTEYNKLLNQAKLRIDERMIDDIIPNSKANTAQEFTKNQDEIKIQQLSVDNAYEDLVSERKKLDDLLSLRRAYQNRINDSFTDAQDLLFDLNNFVGMYDSLKSSNDPNFTNPIGLVDSVKSFRDLIAAYNKELEKNRKADEKTQLNNLDGGTEKLLSNAVKGLNASIAKYLVAHNRSHGGNDEGLIEAGQDLELFTQAEYITNESIAQSERDLEIAQQKLSDSFWSSSKQRHTKEIEEIRADIANFSAIELFARDLFFICRKYNLPELADKLSNKDLVSLEDIEKQRDKVKLANNDYVLKVSELSSMVTNQDILAEQVAEDVRTDANNLFNQEKKPLDEQYDNAKKILDDKLKSEKKKLDEQLDKTKKTLKENLETEKKKFADQFGQKKKNLDDKLKTAELENKNHFEEKKRDLEKKYNESEASLRESLDNKIQTLDDKRLADEKEKAETYNQGVLNELKEKADNLKPVKKEPAPENKEQVAENNEPAPENKEQVAENNEPAPDNNEQLVEEIPGKNEAPANQNIETEEDRFVREQALSEIHEQEQADKVAVDDTWSSNFIQNQTINTKNYLRELSRLAKELDDTIEVLQRNSASFKAFGKNAILTELKNKKNFDDSPQMTKRAFMEKYGVIENLCNAYAEEHTNTTKYPKLKGKMPKRLRIMTRMKNVLKMAMSDGIRYDCNPYSLKGREMMLKEKFLSGESLSKLESNNPAEVKEARRYLLNFGPINDGESLSRNRHELDKIISDINKSADPEKEYLSLLQMDAKSFYQGIITKSLKIEEKKDPKDLFKREMGSGFKKDSKAAAKGQNNKEVQNKIDDKNLYGPH